MYLAPEMVGKRKYGRKVDIWAAGVVVYSIVTGDVPFRGRDVVELGRQIVNREVECKGR